MKGEASLAGEGRVTAWKVPTIVFSHISTTLDSIFGNTKMK